MAREALCETSVTARSAPRGPRTAAVSAPAAAATVWHSTTAAPMARSAGDGEDDGCADGGGDDGGGGGDGGGDGGGVASGVDA